MVQCSRGANGQRNFGKSLLRALIDGGILGGYLRAAGDERRSSRSG